MNLNSFAAWFLICTTLYSKLSQCADIGSLPSSHPTRKPTNSPSLFPSFRSMSPTSEPPSSRPTFFIPTNEPTSFSSLAPSSKPTTVFPISAAPTSYPSNFPTLTPVTSFPSSFPTTLPSAHPSTSAPSKSSHPSSSPSTCLPSSSPSTSRPSSSPSTSRPSSSPSTSLPTLTPSSASTPIPTFELSFNPSVEPTELPSLTPSEFPTLFPSSYPSVAPTYMPTPAMVNLGKSWWYFLIADISLHSSQSLEKYTHIQVQSGVHNAFEFILSDSVEDYDENKLFMTSQVIKDPNEPVSEKDDDYYASNALTQSEDTNSTSISLNYRIQAWCSSITCVSSIREMWSNLAFHPLLAVEPIHEQGIRAIDDVTLLSMRTEITYTSPPILAPLSPTRIVYIIIGVIFFAVVMFVIIKSGCHLWERKRIIRRWCRSRWENIARPCHVFCYDLNRAWKNGFSLTSSQDDDSVDRSGDFDQLSVHYGKNNFSWQQSYLDENDRAECQRLAADPDGASPPESPHDNDSRAVEMTSTNHTVVVNSTLSPMTASRNSLKGL